MHRPAGDATVLVCPTRRVKTVDWLAVKACKDTLPETTLRLATGAMCEAQAVVCTENLNPDVVVMKSAKDHM
jgi:hypothetical protein